MSSASHNTSETQLAYRVSVQTILLNIILSVGKLIAGLVAHSGAMLSDAVHSASDVLSTILVIVGVRMAGKQSEIDGLVYEVVRMGEEYHVPVPAYEKVAEKLRAL